MATSASRRRPRNACLELPTPLRRQILRLAQDAVYWAGIEACMPRQGGAVILMYHSVGMPEKSKYIDPTWSMSARCFEEQMQFLARCRHVISLSELVEQLKHGGSLKPGSVVLTFDDGYKDNLYVAAPILRRYDLPAVISIATDFVTSGENQPIDRLYTIFTNRTKEHLRLPFGHRVEADSIYDLQVTIQYQRAYRICAQRLSVSNREQREQVLTKIEEQLVPTKRPPPLMLNWKEVRELAKRYPEIEISAHTAEHVDLSISDEDTIRKELQVCIDALEREVGVRPRHFCFPYGRSNTLARRLVVEAGFESAMGPTGAFLVDAGTNAYGLPRMDARMSLTQLKFRTHSGFPTLPSWFARRG